ncbi:MAG TPA: cupin domain-containing protein [Chthonomonadaceae bacterium]|nr:cupin domain-containing protein [Chthonomonadaceae bacterium]
MAEEFTENARPYVLQAGEGVPGFGASVKAGRISTDGGLTLIESRTKGGAPLHVHTRENEYFYVVEGTLTVQCGEQKFEAGPRSFVFLPRGIPHSWDVVGEEATVLLMTVPAMLEEFLKEYHEAFSKSPEARNQVTEKFGITFLPESE